MASSVFEGDVKKNLLERTEAEKVFRPWWDTLEDYLLNILIVLGQPVQIIQGTECGFDSAATIGQISVRDEFNLIRLSKSTKPVQ